MGGSDDGADEPRDVLLRRVNEAARSIAHELDVAWRRVAGQQAHAPKRRLFGARPDLDFEAVVKAADGRRINLKDPANSLIVQFPTMYERPHAGPTAPAVKLSRNVLALHHGSSGTPPPFRLSKCASPGAACAWYVPP